MLHPVSGENLERIIELEDFSLKTLNRNRIVDQNCAAHAIYIVVHISTTMQMEL